MTNIAERISSLTDYLLERLRQLNVPIVSNTEKQHRSGIIQLGPFQELDRVMKLLESHNIWVTQRDGGIRISLHYYNNETDINNLVKALQDL